MTHDATAAHVPGFATLAVHAGAAAADRAPPVPVDGIGRMPAPFGLERFGDTASCLGDPAAAALEERVAALEGGTAALAVASGPAARQIVFHTLMEPGDEFIASTTLHGSAIDQFGRAFERFGWRVKWADPADPASFDAAVTERTRAVFVEALADPDGAVTDVEAVAAVARRARVPLIVDNTLATPCLFRPFEHGADIVVHSAAGFLCGHGQAAGGIVVDGGSFDWLADGRFPSLSRPRPEYDGMVLGETFGNFAFAVAARVLGLSDLGPTLSRSDASTILAGIPTLPLRMRRHCENALEVAAFLANHPAVKQVSYPGLPGDPRHALAARFLRMGAGAVLAFRLEGGYDAASRLGSRLTLFSPRADTGGTRSLILHPASMTHRRLTDGGRFAADPDTVRLSVGIEDAADLIADLDRGLGR